LRSSIQEISSFTLHTTPKEQGLLRLRERTISRSDVYPLNNIIIIMPGIYLSWNESKKMEERPGLFFSNEMSLIYRAELIHFSTIKQ
jgi:hypothetical protein